jgi:hypothetical protein
MPSAEAADWILDTYPAGQPDWGEAILLMEHVSLRRADWERLARHYLTMGPYAQDRPYRLFLRMLGVPRFVEIMQQCVAGGSDRLDLLRYHLEPLFRDVQGQDRAAVDAFMAQIGR